MGFFAVSVSIGQANTMDSLNNLLSNSKKDTNRVNILIEIANVYNRSNPVKGLSTSNEAYELSKLLNFLKGESNALNVMANSYSLVGNYNKALDIYLKQLVVAEHSQNSRDLAIAYMNIGIIHTEQLEYRIALEYYLKSDSIIKLKKIEDIKYNSYLNLGDLFDRLNMIDSASLYYSNSLTLAQKLNDPYYLGASHIGLGNCFVKQQNTQKGFENYYKALSYLKKANEEDLYCETLNDMANLFFHENKKDSALKYGIEMLWLAKKNSLQARLYDANSFLVKFYKKYRNADSLVVYLENRNLIKDSIMSREKIKEFQEKTFNEQIRQNELQEARIKQEHERNAQLQFLLIGIFIPLLFLTTIYLSRKKIHIKVIQLLGIGSLLLLFEYLTLLLHPVVVEFTNHVPVLELCIFVCLAAILIPAHHRIEHWMIDKLTQKHHNRGIGSLNFKRAKIKIQKPND
jgi:tetratricopeptide (TPR) repeat protein